jgi:hypothetical protein
VKLDMMPCLPQIVAWIWCFLSGAFKLLGLCSLQLLALKHRRLPEALSTAKLA